MHEGWPLDGEYVPAGHFVQLKDVAEDIDPAGQSMHSTDPRFVLEYFPAEHGVHVVSPPVDT